MDVRQRLKAFREWAGLSRSALAQHLECHPSFVGLVEDGKRSPGATFTHRLEALSKDWDAGPIRTEEWLDDADLDVPPLTEQREARR